MLENAARIFEYRENLMKKLKKYNYESNMKDFRAEYESIFCEMTAALDAVPEEQVQKAADEIAACFISRVQEAFSKRGRIRGTTQMDLNLFMIYYVFPAILLTGHPQAELLCDTICGLWNRSFKDCNISYTDYDTMYNSFNDKLFGVFEVQLPKWKS